MDDVQEAQEVQICKTRVATIVTCHHILTCIPNTEQQEVGCSTKERDLKDTGEIIRFLKDRSPFENTESLYNIVTGLIVGPKVDVDRAETILVKIQLLQWWTKMYLNFLFNVRIRPPTCKQQVL